MPLARGVIAYPHQLSTVKTVLQRLRGRALLCDEVGLGKTVEAGLILLELTDLLKGTREKAIVFTGLRATLERLAQSLASDGIHAALFHGGMTLRDKTASLERFEREAQVLVSSEAGSEGRNLLASPDTLEGHLLELLDAKIHMFELVIGEMDMILGNLTVGREPQASPEGGA